MLTLNRPIIIIVTIIVIITRYETLHYLITAESGKNAWALSQKDKARQIVGIIVDIIWLNNIWNKVQSKRNELQSEDMNFLLIIIIIIKYTFIVFIPFTTNYLWKLKGKFRIIKFIKYWCETYGCKIV